MKYSCRHIAIAVVLSMFSASRAAAALPYRTDVEWQAWEISRDIAEMVVFAKTGALPGDAFAVRIESGSTAEALPVTVSLAKDAAPVTDALLFPDFAVSPASYAPLARKLLAHFSLRAKGGTRSDSPAFLERLTDFQTGVLLKENTRISAWLTAEPLNPDAHEEAAMLVAVVAFKEQTGFFYDAREAAMRAAAHLALAAALRAGEPPSTAGRLATEIVLVVAGDEGRVRDAVRELKKSSKLGAGERAWANAIELYASDDWRIIEKPVTATLVERYRHCHALANRLDDTLAFEFLTKRNTERIPDWSRILLGERTSVDVANSVAEGRLQHEIAEISEVLKGEGRSLPSDPRRLGQSLAAGPYLSVELRGGKAELRAIPWSTWSRFLQRNLLNGGAMVYRHLGRRLGLPEEAAKLRPLLEALFSGLDLEALGRAKLAMEKANNDRRNAGRSPWTTEPDAMKAARAFVQANPGHVPVHVWITIGDPPDTKPAPDNIEYHKWFATDPGPRDVLRSFFAVYNVSILTAEQTAVLRARMPYTRSVIAAAAPKPPSPFGVKEFEALYEPLLEIDIGVMRQRAAYFADDIPRYRQLYEQIAALSPNEWDTLGDTLADRGLDDEAAEAYERLVKESQDDVLIANETEWLLDYYLEKDRTKDAGMLAQRAGETYSFAGLEMKARYLEARGDFAAAEEWYKKIKERYEAERPLGAFYVRRNKARSDTYVAEAAAALQSLLPQGVQRVTLADFTGAPTDGARIFENSVQLSKLGLQEGAVVGALDGVRIRTFEQYRFVRGWTHDPTIRLIVWDGRAWREVSGRFRMRRFGARLQDYRPQ